MITTYTSQSTSVLKITTCQETGKMIWNNPSINGKTVPLNISKGTWKDVVINGTKVPVTNNEMSWILVTKNKTTTRDDNNEELTFIN